MVGGSHPRNGKPVERRGRKAMGPLAAQPAAVCQVTEWVADPAKRGPYSSPGVCGPFFVRVDLNPQPLAKREWIMRRFCEKVVHFLSAEDGPTAVEYAVMLALLILVCMVSIALIGTQTP